jgi:hypothetical protein
MFLYVIEKHRKRSYIDLLFCQSVFCHVYNMHTCVNINTGLDEQIPVLPLIRVNDILKHSSFDNLLCSHYQCFFCSHVKEWITYLGCHSINVNLKGQYH